MRTSIEKAVHNKDASAAEYICNYLRIYHNCTYDQIYQFVNNVAPISRADWDALLYDSDEQQTTTAPLNRKVGFGTRI